MFVIFRKYSLPSTRARDYFSACSSFITIADSGLLCLLYLEMAYEKEQDELEKLMQEMLSEDENSVFGDVYLSDEYQPESGNESSGSSTLSITHKRRKKIHGKCYLYSVPSSGILRATVLTTFKYFLALVLFSLVYCGVQNFVFFFYKFFFVIKYLIFYNKKACFLSFFLSIAFKIWNNPNNISFNY